MKFYSCEEMSSLTGYINTWPGKRTVQVFDMDKEYGDVVLSNIASIVTSSFSVKPIGIKSAFQLTLETDGDSWIHKDDDMTIAGVFYLTPNAPVDSGTTLFNDLNEPLDVIGNVYNRLVLYNANKYHKSSKYFGSDLFTGRLTQVFFIKG